MNNGQTYVLQGAGYLKGGEAAMLAEVTQAASAEEVLADRRLAGWHRRQAELATAR